MRKLVKADGDGNVVVLGSGELVRQGTGKRLFRTTDQPKRDVVPTTTGVLLLSYAAV